MPIEENGSKRQLKKRALNIKLKKMTLNANWIKQLIRQLKKTTLNAKPTETALNAKLKKTDLNAN